MNIHQVNSKETMPQQRAIGRINPNNNLEA